MVHRIREIIRSADQKAMKQYGREHGTLKTDGMWVTQADFDIEHFLRDRFDALFEAHIFGEEGGWTGKESAPYVVIIDPIDGTQPFCDQIPIWGISVGIFHEGEPWLGVFSMPAANHLFVGEMGKGAKWNGKSMTTPMTPITRSSYLGASSDVHQWNLEQYPGKIRVLGVSGYQVILVASGLLQATLLTRFQFYDIAAAAIILWEAGGNLYYLSGEPVSPIDIIKLKEPAEPVLACHPDLFDRTQRYIHSKPTS